MQTHRSFPYSLLEERKASLPAIDECVGDEKLERRNLITSKVHCIIKIILVAAFLGFKIGEWKNKSGAFQRSQCSSIYCDLSFF